MSRKIEDQRPVTVIGVGNDKTKLVDGKSYKVTKETAKVLIGKGFAKKK